MSEEDSRHAVEVAERYADGRANGHELDRAWDNADDVFEWLEDEFDDDDDDYIQLPDKKPWVRAGYMAAWAASSDAISSAEEVVKVANAEERQVCQHLLLDLFGPLPFRLLPPFPASVRTWNDGLVRRLAEEAYKHRVMPAGTLDSLRLNVLADALDEAGADAALVAHLREPGPHYRGCWAVDLLTGRT